MTGGSFLGSMRLWGSGGKEPLYVDNSRGLISRGEHCACNYAFYASGIDNVLLAFLTAMVSIESYNLSNMLYCFFNCGQAIAN